MMTAILVRMEDKVYPTHQVVLFGAPLKITCLSEGDVYWVKNGRRLVLADYRSPTLILHFTWHEDGGLYECHGSVNSGNDKFLSSGVVIVEGTTLYYLGIVSCFLKATIHKATVRLSLPTIELPHVR